MTVEVRPLGVQCNIACRYCYQQSSRDTQPAGKPYDMAKMKAALVSAGQAFTVFGGEPLLVDMDDLKELWQLGLDHYGRNAIQTNGVLITDEHIEAFLRYKVHVGISVDGPLKHNRIRWAGSVEKTDAASRKTYAALEKLSEAGVPSSIIITLHRMNAVEQRLPELADWIRSLDTLRLAGARLHLLEEDDSAVSRLHALTDQENLAAMAYLAPLDDELEMSFDVFQDLERMMSLDDGHATCVWTACDPYTTRAVEGIEGLGQRSNCGRTNKDGVEFLKSNKPGFQRYIALYHTPQEYGGCKGCRFFLTCKGHCPGTAIDGDWRNRTMHCDIWMKLYESLEARGKAQSRDYISFAPDRLEIETEMLAEWASGNNPSLKSTAEKVRRSEIRRNNLRIKNE